MAVTVAECQRMIDACRRNGVKLMIAYRLHFEEINLKAVDLVRRGRIGDPRFFTRSEEHTSELQSLMRISYAVFCLKKTKNNNNDNHLNIQNISNMTK